MKKNRANLEEAYDYAEELRKCKNCGKLSNVKCGCRKNMGFVACMVYCKVCNKRILGMADSESHLCQECAKNERQQ